MENVIAQIGSTTDDSKVNDRRIRRIHVAHIVSSRIYIECRLTTARTRDKSSRSNRPEKIKIRPLSVRHWSDVFIIAKRESADGKCHKVKYEARFFRTHSSAFPIAISFFFFTRTRIYGYVYTYIHILGRGRGKTRRLFAGQRCPSSCCDVARYGVDDGAKSHQISTSAILSAAIHFVTHFQ